MSTFHIQKAISRTLMTSGLALATCSAAISAGFTPSEVSGHLPHGLPAAALAPEPALPAPASWPFDDAFPRTSGEYRLSGGAFFWSDFIYDDTGQGNFTYRVDNSGDNGADIFRAAIGLDPDNTYWRVDFNTLIDPDVPVLAWALDTDANPSTGTDNWPANAGVRSPGLEKVLIVSSRGAWLHDLAEDSIEDLVGAGASLDIDLDARSFVLTLPRTLLPAGGNWTARLAAGVADADGTGFADAPEADDGSANVYNAAFRSRQDEPFLVGGFESMATRYNNGAQSAALAEGDMSAFSAGIDWALLEARVETPEPVPTGFSTRWFVSSVETGQGLNPLARGTMGPPLGDAPFYGRVQPYTVYVPSTYDGTTPLPLSFLLHSGDRNHNGFGSDRQDEIYLPMCEERGSICVTPMGRGNNTWYLNEAELDVWEVWNRMAHAYALDPDGTTISGWSMGGVGTARFATNYPHLFAAAGIISGAGFYNTQGRRDQDGDELRAENLGQLPTYINSGPVDVAYGNTQRWDRGLEAAGVPYRANYYEDADHGQLGLWVGWDDVAAYFEEHAVPVSQVPAHIAFRWEPGDERPDLGMAVDRAYWLSGLRARDMSARWSRVEANIGVTATATLEEGDFMYGERTVEFRTQTLDWPEREGNTLTVSLENVGAIAIDLDRAGLELAENGSVSVETDGATILVLAREGRSQRFVLESGSHAIAPPLAPQDIATAADNGVTTVSWTRPEGVLEAAIDYVVRAEDGRLVCRTRGTSCSLGTLSDEPGSFSISAENVLGTTPPSPIALD
ncbi:MAG: hypothetical protein ABS75_28755 [Pelagibacterium sp. SCN 63-23]|nr:MAG: hypothetical protein ABS75_28755 [Pelagibacterium sp. SCN 63-23]